MRFFLSLPPGTSTPPNVANLSYAPSPDGSRLAMLALDPNSNLVSLWIRRMDDTTAQRIANTEGASTPFWSPDGQYVAFFANRKLKKVAVSGGNLQTICDVDGTGSANTYDGGTWSRETAYSSRATARPH